MPPPAARRAPASIVLAAAIAVLAAAGCLPPAVRADAAPGEPHVVVVSIDGLRPDAIARFDAPTLQRLVREGAHTLDARTILPAKTLPSHTSMLTGVEPAVHGVTWNSDRTDEHDESDAPATLAVPTVFALASDAGLRTAAFFSKAKFHHLQTPGSLDYTQAPRFTWAPWGAVRTSEDAAWYIRRARPNLTFVHIAEPDIAGHAIGWMTPAYGANVAIADRAVARIVEAADATFGPDGYTLVVTADHGGHGRNHGVSGGDSLDVTIPWIAHGARVRAGTRLDAVDVHTTATASTALWLLGVPRPASWPSPPVTAAFRVDSALAAPTAPAASAAPTDTVRPSGAPPDATPPDATPTGACVGAGAARSHAGQRPCPTP